MMRANRKRLASVAQRIDTMSVAPAVVSAAFERFRETGELPDHQRLAVEVVQRALRGGVGPGMVRIDFAGGLRALQRLLDGVREDEPEPEQFRKTLFDEAVYGPSFVRIPARLALKILVDMGRDVTDPEFIPLDTEIPDWGSVGWHLLGFTERIVKPPYEEQAQRLFDRFADLRGRIDRDDKQWFENLADAGCRFLNEGELPDDELLCEAVLANGEFFAVLRHYVGQGDPEVMTAFDQVAKAKGKKRASAIARVSAMAAEGRLVSRMAFE